MTEMLVSIADNKPSPLDNVIVHDGGKQLLLAPADDMTGKEAVLIGTMLLILSHGGANLGAADYIQRHNLSRHFKPV